jgi:hypothetical protein
MNDSTLAAPSTETPLFTPIEKWYSGKALQAIRTFVIPMLVQAAGDGCWPKGASRKVHAALGKQNVAGKFAKANREVLESLADDERTWEAKHRGWTIAHAMQFGSLGQANDVAATVAALRPVAEASGADEAMTIGSLLDTAQQWAADFAPVAALVKTLDASRPKPIIVLGSLSRTVADNVGKAMGVALDTIECPPIEWRWEVRQIKGKTVRIKVGRILWPEGTKHGVSRYARGSSHCHACGHMIYDPYNWVPLVAQTATGPVSLWVGKDCARSLFNADVSGEAEYER